MERVELRLTPELRKILDAMAKGDRARLIEDLLWQHPSVRKVAGVLHLERSKRTRKGRPKAEQKT
jgi:hypothetical protein